MSFGITEGCVKKKGMANGAFKMSTIWNDSYVYVLMKVRLLTKNILMEPVDLVQKDLSDGSATFPPPLTMKQPILMKSLCKHVSDFLAQNSGS